MGSMAVNIGLIGLGTVGSSVVKLLQDNREIIRDKTGFDLILKKIAVRDLKKKRQVKVDSKLLTANPNEILDSKDIDVVVELIGGYEPAKNFILRALENKKYVVTANKALLARDGEELFREAESNNADIYFEASAAGGIPIVLPLGLSLCANRIRSIHAILNGTCNYILTKMSEEGLSYDKALQEAQEKGFAEADPFLDVNGGDSMHKLVILASLAFGAAIKEKDVFVEGITALDAKDMKYASEMGYVVKLLAIAKEVNSGIELRVHPAMIPADNPLASVRNEFNAITVSGDFAGDITFMGKGAGGFPTASAVVADIINIAQDKLNQAEGGVHLVKLGLEGKKKLKATGEIESSYYLRTVALDKPGVFAAISKILADNNISIASIIQKERRGGKTASIVLMTHKTREGRIRKAIEMIDGLEVVMEKTKIIRVEKDSNTNFVKK